MTLQSFQDDQRFAANCIALLQSAGISVTVGYDFDTYKEILEKARPGHVLGNRPIGTACLISSR